VYAVDAAARGASGIVNWLWLCFLPIATLTWGDVEGETASMADGLDGEPEPGPGEEPTNFARALARSVDTSFSVLSVMVSFDFFLVIIRIVDSLLVDMVDVDESFLSFWDVAPKPGVDSATSLLLSFAGTGGPGETMGSSA